MWATGEARVNGYRVRSPAELFASGVRSRVAVADPKFVVQRKAQRRCGGVLPGRAGARRSCPTAGSERRVGPHDRGVDEFLAPWGRAEMIGSLGGGNRNTVLRIGPRRQVARRSRRKPASLDWKIALLDHLYHGLRVPVAVPTLDGRRHVEGTVVQTWLDGTSPSDRDWPAAAAALRTVHALTAGWPQRPGFASTRELLTSDRGGDVDLTQMACDAAAACRRAWATLDGTPEAVVHGDPGPANIRIAGTGVGLLDWDEARVDHTDLDLAELPAVTCHQNASPQPASLPLPGKPPTAGSSSRPTRAANSCSSRPASTPLGDRPRTAGPNHRWSSRRHVSATICA